MKHFILAIMMATGVSVSAQSLPEPFNNLPVKEEQRSLFGEPQTCWVIYGSDNEAFLDANVVIVDNGRYAHFEDDGYGYVYIFDLGNKLNALEFWSHESGDKSRILFYYVE